MLQLLQTFKKGFYFCNRSAFFIRKYADLVESKTYKLCAVPALADNYMYLLINKYNQLAIAIDPVEPDKLVVELDNQKAKLNAILTTHHHLDHCGGNDCLAEKFGIPVYGGDDRIEGLTNKVKHGDRIQLNRFEIECLHTPCHTSGHISYYVLCDSHQPICFTGDTLFIAGCGKFFEGTPEDMLSSLNKLAKLPLNTLVCCGHEYSVSNLKFAVHVDPSNAAAQKKLELCLRLRSENKPTVPSTIKDELSFNPFLRVLETEVQKFTGKSEPSKVIAELRKMKDQFKI